jgi:hypothetical protein
MSIFSLRARPARGARLRLAISLLTSLGALALAACGDDGPDGTKVPTTGGAVTADSGRLTLTVPAGALRSDAHIAVTTASVPTDATAIPESAYDLSPSSLTFSSPVTITLRPRGAIPNANASEWAIAVDRNGTTTEVPATLSNGTFTAQLTTLGHVWVRRMHVEQVTLDRGTAVLDAGKTLQLRATMAGAAGQPLTSPTLAFTSDNTGVATVAAAGLVTAVAPGVARISARSEGKEAVATITVVRRSANTIEILPRTATTIVGEPLTLTAVLRDSVGAIVDRAPTWSSRDPSVATVSATGVVTPLAPGAATIQATADNAVGVSTVVVQQLPVRVTSVVSLENGEPEPLGEVTGSVAVSIEVTPDRLARQVTLVLVCPGRTDVTLATHTLDSSAPGTYAFAVHTATFDAQTGIPTTPNGACALRARLTYADATSRESTPVNVTLANQSHFLASYEITDGRQAVLGIAPVSRLTGGGVTRVAGSVTLRLLGVNYAPGATISSIGGTFLGRTFTGVAPAAGTNRFTIDFPNDGSERGIAGYTSPLEGDKPAVTAMSVSGGPTFTTVEAATLYVDNAAPLAPSTFTLAGATTTGGTLWVPGTYAFDRPEVYAAVGDTIGGSGLAGRAFYGQLATQAGLSGGSATGSECGAGTLLQVTTAADLRALRPAGQTTPLANEFRLRAVEWDRMGNVRCTELGTTFGVSDP